MDATRRNAAAAGVADRIRVEQLDVARGIPGRYDIVTIFDVLHDSPDPAGILRAIHNALEPDGRFVCVDINCSDRPEENVGPTAVLLYGLILEYCLPVSLNGGGAGLGTAGLPKSKPFATSVSTSRSRGVNRAPSASASAYDADDRARDTIWGRADSAGSCPWTTPAARTDSTSAPSRRRPPSARVACSRASSSRPSCASTTASSSLARAAS